MKTHSSYDDLPPKREATRSVGRHDRGDNQPTLLTLPTINSALRLHEVVVPWEWVEYNGHMTEYRYLQVLGETTDALLRLIGAGLDYVVTGHSYYTVETHIQHVREAKAGDVINSCCQVLSSDDKRPLVFHTVINASTNETLANGEHLPLHVDMSAGKTYSASPQILEYAGKIAAAHRVLPWPKGAGRHVAQKG